MPRMDRRSRGLNYEALTKRAFLLSLGLFVVGELTEPLQHAIHMRVPAWEHTLLFYLTVFGVLGALLSPFVFGIVLPLTE